jgi:hypothetical protein
MIAALTT